jgi:hypothetical protein
MNTEASGFEILLLKRTKTMRHVPQVRHFISKDVRFFPVSLKNNLEENF